MLRELCWIDHRHVIGVHAHLAGANRVMDGLGGGPHEGIDRGIGVRVCSGCRPTPDEALPYRSSGSMNRASVVSLMDRRPVAGAGCSQNDLQNDLGG